jgi:hypothetical protein
LEASFDIQALLELYLGGKIKWAKLEVDSRNGKVADLSW